MTTSRYNIMGIDPSLKSMGVAIINGANGELLGSWHDGYSLSSKAGYLKQTRRLLYLASFVIQAAKEYNVQCFVMERCTFGDPWRALELKSVLTAINTQVLLQFGTVPLLVATSTFYQYFLGKWKGTAKQELATFMHRNYGYILANSDEYDAAAMARMVFDNRFLPRGDFDQRRRRTHNGIDSGLRVCGLRPLENT